MIIRKIVSCARCGFDHAAVEAMPLDRPHAPPEAAPVVWTHWAPCPVNGQPIMFTFVAERADDNAPAYKHGVPPESTASSQVVDNSDDVD